MASKEASEGVRTEKDWNQFTVAELRVELSNRGLKCKGRKKEIIEFLMHHDQTSSDGNCDAELDADNIASQSGDDTFTDLISTDDDKEVSDLEKKDGNDDSKEWVVMSSKIDETVSSPRKDRDIKPEESATEETENSASTEETIVKEEKDTIVGRETGVKEDTIAESNKVCVKEEAKTVGLNVVEMALEGEESDLVVKVDNVSSKDTEVVNAENVSSKDTEVMNVDNVASKHTEVMNVDNVASKDTEVMNVDNVASKDTEVMNVDNVASKDTEVMNVDNVSSKDAEENEKDCVEDAETIVPKVMQVTEQDKDQDDDTKEMDADDDDDLEPGEINESAGQESLEEDMEGDSDIEDIENTIDEIIKHADRPGTQAIEKEHVHAEDKQKNKQKPDKPTVMTAERLCEEMAEDMAEEYNEEQQTLNSESSCLTREIVSDAFGVLLALKTVIIEPFRSALLSDECVRDWLKRCKAFHVRKTEDEVEQKTQSSAVFQFDDMAVSGECYSDLLSRLPGEVTRLNVNLSSEAPLIRDRIIGTEGSDVASDKNALQSGSDKYAQDRSWNDKNILQSAILWWSRLLVVERLPEAYNTEETLTSYFPEAHSSISFKFDSSLASFAVLEFATIKDAKTYMEVIGDEQVEIGGSNVNLIGFTQYLQREEEKRPLEAGSLFQNQRYMLRALHNQGLASVCERLTGREEVDIGGDQGFLQAMRRVRYMRRQRERRLKKVYAYLHGIIEEGGLKSLIKMASKSRKDIQKQLRLCGWEDEQRKELKPKDYQEDKGSPVKAKRKRSRKAKVVPATEQRTIKVEPATEKRTTAKRKISEANNLPFSKKPARSRPEIKKENVTGVVLDVRLGSGGISVNERRFIEDLVSQYGRVVACEWFAQRSKNMCGKMVIETVKDAMRVIHEVGGTGMRGEKISVTINKQPQYYLAKLRPEFVGDVRLPCVVIETASDRDITEFCEDLFQKHHIKQDQLEACVYLTEANTAFIYMDTEEACREAMAVISGQDTGRNVYTCSVEYMKLLPPVNKTEYPSGSIGSALVVWNVDPVKDQAGARKILEEKFPSASRVIVPGLQHCQDQPYKHKGYAVIAFPSPSAVEAALSDPRSRLIGFRELKLSCTLGELPDHVTLPSDSVMASITTKAEYTELSMTEDEEMEYYQPSFANPNIQLTKNQKRQAERYRKKMRDLAEAGDIDLPKEVWDHRQSSSAPMTKSQKRCSERSRAREKQRLIEEAERGPAYRRTDRQDQAFELMDHLNSTVRVKMKELEMMKTQAKMMEQISNVSDNLDQARVNLPHHGTAGGMPPIGTAGQMPPTGTAGGMPFSGPSGAMPLGGTVGRMPFSGTAGGMPQGGTAGRMPFSGPSIGMPFGRTAGRMPFSGPSGGIPLGGTAGRMPFSGPSGGMPQGGTAGRMPFSGTAGGMPPGGTAGRMPFSGPAGGRPPGGTAGRMPFSGTAGGMPPGGTAGRMPFSGTAGGMSFTGTAGGMPPGGTAGRMPFNGPAGGMSFTGTAGGMPQGGTAGRMPPGGTAGRMPFTGTAGGMPQGGTAGRMPFSGTAGGMPHGGTAEGMPLDGTPGRMPFSGTAGGMPHGGTASRMPVPGIALQKPISESEGKLPNPGTASKRGKIVEYKIARPSQTKPIGYSASELIGQYKTGETGQYQAQSDQPQNPSKGRWDSSQYNPGHDVDLQTRRLSGGQAEGPRQVDGGRTEVEPVRGNYGSGVNKSIERWPCLGCGRMNWSERRICKLCKLPRGSQPTHQQHSPPQPTHPQHSDDLSRRPSGGQEGWPPEPRRGERQPEPRGSEGRPEARGERGGQGGWPPEPRRGDRQPEPRGPEVRGDRGGQGWPPETRHAEPRQASGGPAEGRPELRRASGGQEGWPPEPRHGDRRPEPRRPSGGNPEGRPEPRRMSGGQEGWPPEPRHGERQPEPRRSSGGGPEGHMKRKHDSAQFDEGDLKDWTCPSCRQINWSGPRCRNCGQFRSSLPQFTDDEGVMFSKSPM